ncbi:DNA-protecting protein DprA [Staphylococcus sp. 17KM0847]|nr:DNA-protecting protein DprA [Staphylococcus sp. 17KM0847]
MLLLIYAGFRTQQLRTLSSVITSTAITPQQLYKRLSQHPSFKSSSSFHTKLKTLKTLNIGTIEHQLKSERIQTLSLNDPLYPRRLKAIYDPPLILFCKGHLHYLNHPHILAIVGSRKHTQYTVKALDYLLPEFARAGLLIVSGLAHGADAYAHQYAIEYGCPTIGVLGFGHLYHYPKTTQILRNSVERYGVTVSEYPPHCPPARFQFPERNRIISGLSQGVLITEAKEKSGALITVDQALEQNRNVYVLPGDMFNPYTKGNLLRIQEGAEVVLSSRDILKDYSV